MQRDRIYADGLSIGKPKYVPPNLLPQKELAAVNKYMSSDAYKINEALRNGEKLNKIEQTFVDTLDRALKKIKPY